MEHPLRLEPLPQTGYQVNPLLHYLVLLDESHAASAMDRCSAVNYAAGS